jgi:hypothetical protein
MYCLYIYRRIDALAFLEGVFPYLRIKKLEAQDILRWLRLYPPLPGTRFHSGMRKGVMLPEERMLCTKGHVLTNDNVYLMRQRSVRRPVWKACRICAIERRMQHYEEVVKPIMTAYGLGMREVNADVISRARQEGVIQ